MAEKKEKRYVSDNAQLMAEWDWEKNSEVGLLPNKLTCGSKIKAWWMCDNGHNWDAKISNRNNGRGCPICSSRRVLPGYNDLTAINPQLCKEWNFTKNIGFSPEDFTANSHQIVWWKCAKGHEWEAKISNRNNGRGCPVCASERQTSFPEYALLYYLNKHGFKAVHLYKEMGYELDIYIPCLNVAIEYDGYYWHKNKIQEDINKNQKCKASGIKLYRLREGLPTLNNSSIDYIVQRNQQNLGDVIGEVINDIIGIPINIDLKKDSVAIENLREFMEKNNSILLFAPEIIREWNHDKNGNLKPEYFLRNTRKKVWWKCSHGHEWQTAIANRSRGHGCPYCSGQKVLKGFNDLQTVNSLLSEEWNYEKNMGINPIDVTPSSNKEVWWKCQNGHEWKAKICNRNNGKNCPYCSGRYAITGVTDLKTKNPQVSQEWNYSKNGSLKPENFTPNSHQIVWWKCDKGHEWQASIANRNKGSRCCYCSGQKTLPGFNDLQTVSPILSEEWNYKKNVGLLPSDVMAHSNRKIWWKCKENHEWSASINSRTRGNGCPYCAGKLVIRGENDLKTINPRLALEWNYEKNNGITPMDVMPGSKNKAWWKCAVCGHQWEAIISNRNKGRGCPECAKQKRKK